MNYKQLKKSAEENLSRAIEDYPSIDDMEMKTSYISALSNTLRLLIIPLADKQQKEEERRKEGKFVRGDFHKYVFSVEELKELQFDNGDSPLGLEEGETFQLGGMWDCTVTVDRDGIMLQAIELPGKEEFNPILDILIYFRPSGGYYYSGEAAVQDAIAILDKAIALGDSLDLDRIMDKFGFELVSSETICSGREGEDTDE